MKAAEKAISNLLLKVNPHLDVEFWQDQSTDCVRLLARTKPHPPFRYLVRDRVVSEPCYWANSWWAGAIKWCLRYKYTRWLIPYPLEALACATEVTISATQHELPAGVISSIHAQIAEIKMGNREPKVIAIGYQANDELLMSRHVSVMPVLRRDSEHSFTFAGYKVIATRKLEKDAVIVL